MIQLLSEMMILIIEQHSQYFIPNLPFLCLVYLNGALVQNITSRKMGYKTWCT